MRIENVIFTAGQISRTQYYSVCSGNFAESKHITAQNSQNELFFQLTKQQMNDPNNVPSLKNINICVSKANKNTGL